MTKPLRKPKALTDRVVYDVRPSSGKSATIEASSTADLADQLTTLLGLDPYGSRAVAHSLHVLRANVTAPTWSARRVGVMSFVPDDAPVLSKPIEGPMPATPTASPDVDKHLEPTGGEGQGY